MLQRVLQLPVVSGTRECVQKTYHSTKDAHPLVASVCNAYEKGVQGASSLAAWGMEPVVRRLSTQCECPHPSQRGQSCPQMSIVAWIEGPDFFPRPLRGPGGVGVPSVLL